MVTATRIPEVIESATKDGTRATVVGRYRTCTVKPNDGGYLRITQNGSRHGRRYHFHKTYDEAIAAAFAWGNRPLRAGGL